VQSTESRASEREAPVPMLGMRALVWSTPVGGAVAAPLAGQFRGHDASTGIWRLSLCILEAATFFLRVLCGCQGHRDVCNCGDKVMRSALASRRNMQRHLRRVALQAASCTCP
jgi:hypothetical protein